MLKKLHTGNGEPPPKKKDDAPIPMGADEGDTGNGEPPPK